QFFAASLLTFIIAQAGGTVELHRTSLELKKCKRVEQEPGLASTKRCPGFQGYVLLVHYEDERESIDVLTPTGARHELNFWQVVTKDFSEIASPALWVTTKRANRIIPVALIVKLREYAPDERSPERTRRRNYFVVSKITAEAICVTDKIPA